MARGSPVRSSPSSSRLELQFGDVTDMSRPTKQNIDLKIESAHNYLIWLTWAFGANAVMLILTLRSGSQSDLTAVTKSVQLVFLGLSIPMITIVGLRYVELLFQRYDRA
jgi:hypothetical protein